MKRILTAALGILLCVGMAGTAWADLRDLDLLNFAKKFPNWTPHPKPPIQWYVPDNPEKDSTPYVYFYISEAASLDFDKFASLAPMSAVPKLESKHGAYASTYQWVRARIDGTCQWIYMQGYYTPC